MRCSLCNFRARFSVLHPTKRWRTIERSLHHVPLSDRSDDRGEFSNLVQIQTDLVEHDAVPLPHAIGIMRCSLRYKMANLSKIPLVALSIDTKQLVSTLLNPTKWIPTHDGLPRDWRGLAHLCDLGGQTIPSLASHSDPTGQIMTIIQDKTPACSLEDLESMLGQIDRWDIIDDVNSLFERDAQKYLERAERCQTSASDIENVVDKQILTIDDLYRHRQGLNNQCYDAFLLYSDLDMDFVTEMIENLENKQNLKLCIKDRDLIGGITFEHEAVMQLISERCNRMIVVVSPNFLESSANKFFLNYAQAVGIEMRQRKIVPCLYKKCQLPPQLCYTFILDYSKVGLYDFWGRLRDSVSVVSSESASNRILPTQQLSQRDEKLPAIINENDLKPTENDIACADPTVGPYKQINNKKSSRTSDGKTAKSEISETISLTVTLPSLDNLPSLDMSKTMSNEKTAKRRKNIVGKCVKKVQALLAK